MILISCRPTRSSPAPYEPMQCTLRRTNQKRGPSLAHSQEGPCSCLGTEQCSAGTQKITVEPRGTKPCNGRARRRICPRSCCCCRYPSRTQSQPSTGGAGPDCRDGPGQSSCLGRRPLGGEPPPSPASTLACCTTELGLGRCLVGNCNHATGRSESVRRYAVRPSSGQFRWKWA